MSGSKSKKKRGGSTARPANEEPPKEPEPAPSLEPSGAPADAPLGRRHLAFGWGSVAVFATFGLVLEMLHGFKVGFFLDVSNETRRLMWQLAHAHGTLFGILNIGFSWSLERLPEWAAPARERTSKLLIGGSVLMPAGFLLGGTVVYGGDPGVGVLLTPVGAVMIIAAAALTARASLRG